jgi:hypothetical protein
MHAAMLARTVRRVGHSAARERQDSLFMLGLP